MRNIVILFGIAILLIFNSCKDKNIDKETVVLSTQEFYDATAKNNVQLLDVRTAKEFEAGHLEDAINIDVLEADFSEKAESLDKEQALYLYCRSGNRSAKASAILKDLGFKEIYDMEGGYLQWESTQIEDTH